VQEARQQPQGAARAVWSALRGLVARKGATIQAAGQMPLSSGYAGSELYEILTGGGQLSSSGMVVNERTAMCVSAVYSCVGLIAGAVSGLTVDVFDHSSERGRLPIDPRKDKSQAGKVWWLLNEQPYESVSSAVFWEWLISSLLLQGDAFAVIRRHSARSPEIIAFEPVHPIDVGVMRDPADPKRLLYSVRSFETGHIEAVSQDDMLHVPGLGFDGFRGMPVVRYAARSAIGIALAADEYQAKFFANGARPDFVFKTDKPMQPAQIEALRTQWMEQHGGPNNARLPGVLTGGLSIEKLSMSAEDAQLISTRNFQVVDIARIFGVPPHMVGEDGGGVGKTVESLGRQFAQYTLKRHLRKFEIEIGRKVFPRTMRYSAKFNLDELLRGDAEARAKYNAAALGGNNSPGWLTQNEVRADEDRPAIEGGDKLVEWNRQQAAPAPTQSKKATVRKNAAGEWEVQEL
jgi:HK97 family phage portal protein